MKSPEDVIMWLVEWVLWVRGTTSDCESMKLSSGSSQSKLLLVEVVEPVVMLLVANGVVGLVVLFVASGV